MPEKFMIGDQFAEYIKNMIPGTKSASGGKELVCRCRYCADSSDPSHGHMYIHVPQDKDDPPTFHCFKCQTSGVVDSSVLIDWGLYSPEIGLKLDKIKSYAVKNRKFLEYNKLWYNINNHVRDFNLAQHKVDYINQRLGTNLSIYDCLQNKIILNLRDVLEYNHIQRFTRHENIINQLNDNFVGFLSLDNNFVNMRRMCDEGIVYNSIDKRYINYNIHDKRDNTEKMYVLPTVIDLSSPHKVNIHIAEGPFDILSIKYNLRKNEPGIYAAVTGAGYKGLIMHLISTFKIFYFDLHIYPDNDKFGSDVIMNDIRNAVAPYGATIYEHRNISYGEKDFGVSLDRINEKVYI